MTDAPRQRAWLIGALVLAVATLVTSIVAVAVLGPGRWSGGVDVHGGAPMSAMMGGELSIAGDDGPVTSLDEARGRAQSFADRLGLDVGEVMQFSNGYYAELLTADGQGATEVLIDPDSGAVGIEYGPAMMWNTEYGMHARGAERDARVSPDQAQAVAQEWLERTRPGRRAGEAEAFPGYYTLHTFKDGEIEGMLSVNATTSAVWYHTWHGTFTAMSEDVSG